MEKLFQSVQEHPERRPAILTGKFPEWLQGRLFRLGPAKWDLSEDFSLNHWLDGCALLYKFTIQNGQVDVMSRFLDSEAYQKMVKVQRPVFTEFGTKSYPDPCKNVFSRFFSQLVPLELTDNAMANIYNFEDELYCVSETCHLWKVDHDLNAKRRIDLKQLLSVNLASSHPHKSPDGTVYNLGASFMTGLRYHIVKVPPQSAKITESERIGYERGSLLCSMGSSWKTSFSYYHSFGLSEHYLVFVEQPMLVNTIKMAASGIKGHALRECMEWLPKEKSRFHVIERVSGQVLKLRFQTDAFFFFHHVNTFEENGQLVVDIMGFDSPEVMDKFYLKTLRLGEFDTKCPPQLRRFVLPLNQDAPKGKNLVQLKNCTAEAVRQENGVVFLKPQFIGEAGFELPTINYSLCNTRNYRYVYGSGVFETGPYRNSLVKLDVTTGEMLVWREKSTMYPSEANFIQRPNSRDEDDGVILSIVLDVESNCPDFLLVLDAKTFQEIARAEVPADVRLPPTVHGCFLPDRK